ncbi:MAG: hypothetical protein K9W44_10405 [Candidatus Lokiarchaeota archaeon]|nr:hypothetical protein [Candidatus Harpocratesius repetitus]
MITTNSKYFSKYFSNNFYNYLIRNKPKEIGLNEIIEGGKLTDFNFKEFYGIDSLIENPKSFSNLEIFIFDLLESFADHFRYKIIGSISDGEILIQNREDDTLLKFNFIKIYGNEE